MGRSTRTQLQSLDILVKFRSSEIVHRSSYTKAQNAWIDRGMFRGYYGIMLMVDINQLRSQKML
jgi:hypothetical protein